VQYFFPFFPRPFSSTFLMILRVFSRKLSKSSFWNQRSFGSSVTDGMCLTSASSRNVQLLIEHADEKESDNDVVELEEFLRSIFECVERDGTKGNDGLEERDDLLSIFDNEGMEYDNDDDDAEEQEALLSLLRGTRRGRWADSPAKMDGCMSLSLIAIAERYGLFWFRN